MAIGGGILGIEQGRTSHQLEKFSHYLKLLESHIQESRHEWEKRIDQQASQIQDSNERDQFLEMNSDEYWEFKEYEIILRNFFLVTTYAFLEVRLKWFCDTVQRRRKIPISWSDLRGDMLDKAKKYLVGLGGVHLSTNTPEWQEIRRHEKLRHSIVHNAGRLSKSDKGLWTYATKKCLVSADGSVTEDVIELTPEFCQEVLEITGKFLNRLHQSLRHTLSRPEMS